MRVPPSRLRGPAVTAWRALLDCRVVRVRFDHPGFLALYDAELVDVSPVADDEDALDYRLTVRARAAA